MPAAINREAYFGVFASLIAVGIMFRAVVLFFVLGLLTHEGSFLSASFAQNLSIQARAEEIFSGLPSSSLNDQDLSDAQMRRRLAQERVHQELLQEKLQDKWFAALISIGTNEIPAITTRFATWKSLVDFIQDQNAIIEMWAYAEGGNQEPRRISAAEAAELKRQTHERPSVVTLTYRDKVTEKVRKERIEFGFKAAEIALEAHRGYQRQRQLQLTVQEILGAKDEKGRLNALKQWKLLTNAIIEARLELIDPPQMPKGPSDLFVAVEYEVDEADNLLRIAGIYRASEIQKRILQDKDGRSIQIIELRKDGEKQPREASGFAVRGVSDELVPMPNPILGQDQVQLRIKNSAQPDPRKWNVLEFGEPELLKEAALARFALINAHLDKQRKAISLRKSKYDLIAEPLIAGLSIGGGLSGLGFPAGDAGRLLYNLISTRLIADVPTVRELRELFALMAARDKHPAFKTKPAEFLSPEEIKQLTEKGRKLSDTEVLEYLENISDNDLKGMLGLARMAMFDARITNFLNILTSAGRVSGVSDSGILRDIFNSVYFSLNGDINLKTILAVAIGQRIMTPLSGISLEALSHGEGPAKAWLQFFEFSVDIRAVVNTLVRLSKRTLAKKELEKPFPYAPRLSDVAAYEIRIFGFPLMIFYKRGLIKDDYEAFQNDYAYGLIGVSLVEHFASKEAMDAEIRAGRMAPLGYVRIFNGKKGWKDSNLAVFAHRIEEGKYKGKTAIIIYGLKAYAEHSQYIERELTRFQQYETALQEGAVIEQVIQAGNRNELPSPDLEPVIHLGPTADEQIYTPLLSGLLELRRYWQYKTLGLPLSNEDSQNAGAILEKFAARDIWFDDRDPIIGIDKFNGAFLYRKSVQGRPREVKMTLISSLAALERDLKKREEGQQIEHLRREAVSPSGDGIVLINEAKLTNDRYEVGPLIRDNSGQVFGTGIRNGSEAVESVLKLIDQLSIKDRARLRFNNYSATVIEMDLDGSGIKTKVFVTIEFPINRELRRAWINPSSGERENLVFQNGLWRKSITVRRIVEIDYDESNRETGTHTYFNKGTLNDPALGPLLEETRTLSTWYRDLNLRDLDPYLPIIAKLKVNYVTGEMKREVYGLFPFPVETADDQFISENRFSDQGLFESARIFDNGTTDEDLQRPLINKLQNPINGRERFALASILRNPAELSITAERRDLIKGISKTIVFDQAHYGREISESWNDAFNGTNSFRAISTREYREDFHFGLVPFETTTRGTGTGAILSTVSTLDYDPVSRRFVGRASDYTGKVSTNVWDYRWENPIETETALRKTFNRYDRFDTSVTGTTLSKPEQEQIRTFSGRFDSSVRQWELTQTIWFRPGIASLVETNVLSGFGKLLLTRAGGLIETRAIYNPDGIEESRQTWIRNGSTGQFDLLRRLEDNYIWHRGGRDAHVQVFVDGSFYDEFRTQTDEEGRTVTDGIRKSPGLEIRTELTYDSASERTAKAEEKQNGQLRLSRYFQRELNQTNGTFVLPVKVVPAWGLTSTQTWLIGDVFGRSIQTVSENGDVSFDREWFDGTSIPKISEVRDRHGRIRERFVKALNQGVEHGIPFDRTAHYKISQWGAPGLIEEQMTIRGTDISLFKDTGDQRVYFNLDKIYTAPWYEIDRSKESGGNLTLNQHSNSNVVKFFNSEIKTDTTPLPEQFLVVDAIDFRGLFTQTITRQTVDRAGKTVDEIINRISNVATNRFTAENLRSLFSQAAPWKNFRHYYERGWISEAPGSVPGDRKLIFAKNPPIPAAGAILVNDGPWREFETRIDAHQAGSANQFDDPDPLRISDQIHLPEERERNRYLPDRTNAWTEWTVSHLGRDGSKLYDSEAVYDAQGNLSVVKTTKGTMAGFPAAKIGYFIEPPAPGVLREYNFDKGPHTITLTSTRGPDFSGSDFVYFYWTNQTSAPWHLIFTDRSGRKVTLSKTTTWTIGKANERWLPDRILPQQGVSVDAPRSLLNSDSVAAISVHDLALGGLDIRHVDSCALTFTSQVPTKIAVSPLYHLVRDGEFVDDSLAARSSSIEQNHASGFKVFTSSSPTRTDREKYSSAYERSVVESGGLPIAVTEEREKGSPFPPIVVLDQSDADSPRPLYAISSEEGHFIEHYKTRKLDSVQIYTIVRGFGLPKFEIFDPRILEDELAPGFIAYGYDYHSTIKYAKGNNFLTHPIAALRNRIGANAFKSASDQFHTWFSEPDNISGQLRRYHYSLLHNAKIQAETIKDLPMLAQALLTRTETPWNVSSGTPAPEPQIDRKKVALELLILHVKKFPPPFSGLIPTSLGTAAERYADTIKEADLIKLAVGLNELGLARDLLEFYWDKSQHGIKPLHASYDAQAGTAMAVDFLYKRPLHAKPTAEAQLAIADAAFSLGIKTSDLKWMTLGRNLLSIVLKNFRARAPSQKAPLGITEYKSLSNWRAYGVTFWPEAEVYSLRSNARAYLILRQLADLTRKYSTDEFWKSQINKALAEQEAWLRFYILPEVERSGVVPKGLFQIQDINQASTALGIERWTSPDDWLSFLEAAQRMGVPPEKTQNWLDNLARVHGVRVEGRWGLDWSIALLRRDAISPELTAKFWRVSTLLAHQPAKLFAQQSLSSLKNADGSYPAVLTGTPPALPLPSGQGFAIYPATSHHSWPKSFGVAKELIGGGWDSSKTLRLETKGPEALESRARRDLDVFIFLTALFYLAILGTSVFWWHFRSLRRNEPIPSAVPTVLVPDSVMQLAEKRWSKRVLGVQTPSNAEYTRFSNSTVEQNFLMQLRAIYKLVLEWRRQENEWTEDDPRLVEDETDDWLNGLDEFASFVGIYMRFVIKAGTKDGFSKADALAENEDSNHIWSRLVMYFSEYYWALLSLMTRFNNLVTYQDKAGMHGEIARLLKAMGMRERPVGFDARFLFNFPANPLAMDLLIIQKPGAALSKVLLEASMKLKIPYSHLTAFVEKYKAFKKRENPYPLHPYLIEAAKVLPHFFLMGLGALVWYNQTIGDSPIVPYLWSQATDAARDPASLIWGLPLLGGILLSVAGYFARIYRFDGSMLSRVTGGMILDATVTSLFVKKHSTLPQIKPGRLWKAEVYEWAGLGLRTVGFFLAGLALLRLETPSFATFLVVKGLFAMLAFAEVGGIVLPLAATALSKFLQDRVTAQPAALRVTHFLNRLNITATAPASPTWLSIKYHLQPSVPTGGFWGMVQAIVFYFVLAATFFFVGGFLCQQIFSLWFTDTYLNAANWKLFIGGLFFWNTMYLLRYGLFLMFTGIASFLVTFPIKGVFGFLCFVQIALLLLGRAIDQSLSLPPNITYCLLATGIILILFEHEIAGAARRLRAKSPRHDPDHLKLEQLKSAGASTLGVVYMGGDDLSYQKLTPALLMSRWTILRDKLDSESLQLLANLIDLRDDALIEKSFKFLYETERKSEVTLWHPSQITVTGAPPRLPADSGLILTVENDALRAQLLAAWHARRWLVTMMSTAGHAQDTAITLVDIALRLAGEGLASNAVFYLIQNKYDNNDNNRPIQTPYDKGELGQRNKLASLLKGIAPGARAYSIQNWTPFGFKAGGLTGMDLVPEESLKLTTMLVLDRNATVHDLDALMRDLVQAMTDPDVVIIIPGRGTTNTLTPIGQGSQMVEEGHRSFLKGLMGLLGGTASESVGTGWGNILAVFYGRVQRAMVDSATPKMPLTSRMRRGSSFAVRTEGLIGFGPHAVGISEDTWAVSQTAHNAIAFGQRVKFLLSRAMWHKIRETWSHSEWLASFPRWSGGFVQMMHDPIMQRINDFGAASVFAKEIRANSGRNFLSAPFALLNILLMPLAIMLDVTPFVQILIVLWNFGFIMNQVLTVHGLNAYLESRGFYRLPAVLGALAAGAISYFVPVLQPFAPALIMLGLLYGGFIAGVNRWLFTRVRDVILFGPQLVLHTLGQIVRQSMEFTLSGASPEDAQGVNMSFRAWAGPREDRPLDGFPNFINMKTVVWIVGLLSVMLNLFALSNLDMLNVLLLLPSLLFSVSATIGPFVLRPKVGQPIGKWIIVPKVLGWLVSFTFFTLVSVLIGRGHWWMWAGALLFAGVFGLVLLSGLKYGPYHRKLRKFSNDLGQLLRAAGIGASETGNLVYKTIHQSGGDMEKIKTILTGGAVTADQVEAIVRFCRERLDPLLKNPAQDLRKGRFATSRFVSEFHRSFILSLFVLVWFFVVPVPGLFVFTAGPYRFSLELGTIAMLVGSAVGIVLAGSWLGQIVQWIDRVGLKASGLNWRIQKAYRSFQALMKTPGKLTDQEISSVYASFTDVKTYVDQRSYEYARRSIALIESTIGPAEDR